MLWKGCLIGAAVGGFFGGPVGSLLGSIVGGYVERELNKGEGSTARRFGQACGRAQSSHERGMVFCASAAAMMAKMAKADGHVSRVEIAAVEDAFRRLGFSSHARAQAVKAFRHAKDDAHTIYEYAEEFVRVAPYAEARELFYELLWNLAAADGRVTPAELDMLRRLPASLRINPQWFSYFASERLRGESSGARAESRRDPLADAYSVLGVSAQATNDEVKRAYREKAKKYHPDVLKAQGVPDEMIGRTTELMSKINAAWAEIRSARGI